MSFPRAYGCTVSLVLQRANNVSQSHPPAGSPATPPVHPAQLLGGRAAPQRASLRAAQRPGDLWPNTQALFFRRNSPEPDQARESFLLKNFIVVVGRAARARPRGPARPPAGSSAGPPLPRPLASPPPAGPPCLPAWRPPRQPAGRPARPLAAADQGAALCKILELLRQGVLVVVFPKCVCFGGLPFLILKGETGCA